MDDTGSLLRQKRYVVALEFLIASAAAINLIFVFQEYFSNEDQNFIPSISPTFLKFIGLVLLLLLKRTLKVQDELIAILSANFMGFWILSTCFDWKARHFFLASECYRLVFLSLVKVLLSGGRVKLGFYTHFYAVILWYAMCISKGVFNGIDESYRLSTIVLFVFLNESVAAFLMFQDFTNQFNYIRKVTELKQQMQNVFKSIPEAIFVVRADLSLIMRNTEAETIMAETSEDFLKHTELILDDESQVKLPDKVEELLVNKSQEVFLIGKSQLGEKTFEWKVSLVKWEGKTAATLLMRDVTLLMQLESAKHEAHIKNVMMRSVSHELRTPANAFTNLIERTIGCAGLPEVAKNFLELAHDNCQHLLHVVNDLLDYSQFLHGSFKLNKRKFDLRQTLKSSFKPYEYMIRASGLEAIIHVDSTLPINGINDPSRITQVIMNLLSNATKFTRKGQVMLTASRVGINLMSVEVSDTGVGISMQQQALLCTLFGKLKENESLNPQGCGLGLHISNLLALQLGGEELKINSVFGEGTSVSFLVNLSDGEYFPTDYSLDVEEEKISFAVPLFNFSSQSYLGKVLVVDDNVFNRDIISSILKDIGVECVKVSSGFEAIEAILEHKFPFQLMFLDYEMPELNGPETAKRLHSMLDEGELMELPVIVAYTAYSSEKDIQECRDAGMEEFLSKPCSARDVKQMILKYCTKYQFSN